MIKNYSIHYFFLFVASLLLIPSCTEDDPIGGGGGGGAIGPSSTLISGTDLVTSSATIAPGGSFTVNLTASQGDATMNSLTIQKDGSNLDASSIVINGTAASANPTLLFNNDQVNLDYTIAVTTDLVGGETATYSFIITDSDNLTTTEPVSITAEFTSPTLTNLGNMAPLDFATSMFFEVNFEGSAGSSPLATMTILENDIAIDPMRILITGVDITENPFMIPSDSSSGFTWDIAVKSSDVEMSATFTWILTDSLGNTAELTREVITVTPGTPIDSIKTELSLFNQGGPAGTGGVNLITGASVGSDDADAHLQDAGIDLDLPAATNWMQQIGPGAATTALKAITSAQPEGFSYDAVDTKEAIEAAFDLETNTIDDVTFSSVVAVGDMFVLQTSDGEFILVRVDDLEVITDGNSDRYILSAKF